MRRGSIALLVAVAAASAAQANIVVNGSFENDGLSGWTVTPAAVGSNIASTGAASQHGDRSVFFGGTAFQFDTISQILPTTAGQSYIVSFWVLNFGVGEDALRVSWEGNVVLDENPVAHPLESWDPVSFQVTATQNGSTLAIGGYDVPVGFYVDNVSVTLVPAPGMAVALAAAAGLATRRRR